MATSGPEDARTELLAELIKHPAILRAFLSRIGQAPPRGALRISTRQANVFARGIPDLVLEAEGFKVIVEDKLGAEFTDNQPKEYLEELVQWRAKTGGDTVALVIQGQPEAARIRSSHSKL
jgi:hypothetical protein